MEPRLDPTSRQAIGLEERHRTEKSDIPDVSILIVNWNTEELLFQCLDSVFSQTTSSPFEVIVIDNFSTDGSVSMVKEKFPEVKLIENRTNLGFSAANNQGIELSRGRYILLLNSDTVILDRAIEKTIAYADRYEDTASIGCRILNPDRSLQNSCFMFPSILNFFLFAFYLHRLFPKSRFFGRERMTWWMRDDAREVDVVTGCFMLVRRQAIEDVGAMDEGFFMYAEETDWCYRFKQKGWKNRFTPEATIIHVGGASAVKLGPKRAKISNASWLYYMSKHWSKPKALLGACLLMCFYFIRLLYLMPKQVIIPTDRDITLIENHWAGFQDILARSTGRQN